MVNLTGQEAHLILFAFDSYFNTDEQGKIRPNISKFMPSRTRLLTQLSISNKELQNLRDKLFNNHEHFKVEE